MSGLEKADIEERVFTDYDDQFQWFLAIAFALLVEFLNMRLRKKQQPIQLHGFAEEAQEAGLLDEIK